MILALLILALLCAGIPCVLFCVNLRLYVPPPAASAGLPAVSILIPARNEADGIADALTAALATHGIAFEIVVMDDASTDATPEIVLAQAVIDPRVRLERAPALPPGWNGKQHACWALAKAARNPILCFVDADVRLNPDCLARMATFLVAPQVSNRRTGSRLLKGTTALSSPGPLALVSGFPRQLTGTPLEWLLIPLIHFVLLGFLPLSRMRQTTDPAFAAGCGQFFLCDREAYFACGGHSGIPLTMHDGLRLPRLFRQHGYRTDLADLTNLAHVRMYTNAKDTWLGLAKNATEGIAAPARIVPISLILLLGQVLPFVLFLLAIDGIHFDILLTETISGLQMPTRFHPGIPPFSWILFESSLAHWFFIILTGLLAAWLPRILAARRFRQDWRSALLHPFGILLLLAVQWYALLRKLLGRQVTWRNRSYQKPSA